MLNGSILTGLLFDSKKEKLLGGNGKMGKNEVGYIMPSTKRTLQSDLHVDYINAVENIRGTPARINCYQSVFCKILRDYTETHGELLISDDGKEIYFARDGTPLTDFGVIPLSVIHQYSEGGVDDYLELLILGKGIPSKIVKICGRDLGTAQWIDSLGINYIYERQEIWNIKILIQRMAKYAPVKEEFLYFGWSPDGQNFYVMRGQKICEGDWDEECAKKSCRHTLKMLDVAPHSLTIVLLAIAILSLVQSRMIGRGIYFKGVCSIVAQTQSFKTTLASLFFDLADGRKTDINFEASTAAIIRTIGNARDSTVVLDDYKPGATKTESREMLQKINTVIRCCSDDSGGVKRAGMKNETVTNSARCLVVVTAEYIHFDVQSTLARLLILEMNRKSVDQDKLTYFQQNHAIYQECIKNFIQYIIRQGINTFCGNLEQRFLQERYSLQTELFAHEVSVDNRTSDMCTWLNITFSEFLKYALSVNAITQEDFEKYKQESKAIFLSVMEKQAERVAELDEVRCYFVGLRVLLETEEEYLGELQSRNTNYATANSKSAIGFKKKGFVYLKNDVAFQKVVSYFRRNGKEFVISESELRRKLADRGYINRKNPKTYIHRLSINRENYQCIQFKDTNFYNFLEGGQGNGSESEKEVSGDRGLRQNANAIIGRGN